MSAPSEVDDRLVVEPQLAALERLAQVVLELDALHRLGAHRRLEQEVAGVGSPLARTIAISASRISSSASPVPGCASAMPIDALRNQSRPLSGNGAPSSSAIRSAMRAPRPRRRPGRG